MRRVHCTVGVDVDVLRALPDVVQSFFCEVYIERC